MWLSSVDPSWVKMTPFLSGKIFKNLYMVSHFIFPSFRWWWENMTTGKHITLTMNQYFTLGGQSIGVSDSASVFPKNIQDWLPVGLTDLISLQSKGLSRVFSNTTVQKHQFFGARNFLWSNSHPRLDYWKKNIVLTRWTFVGKIISLLNYILLRLIRAFLPRSKCLLITWLQSPSAVILEPKKKKSVSFHCFPIYLPLSDGNGRHDLCFLNVEF